MLGHQSISEAPISSVIAETVVADAFLHDLAARANRYAPRPLVALTKDAVVTRYSTETRAI